MISVLEIVQLAFINELVKSGTSEVTKKSIPITSDLIKRLRDLIRDRFKSNERAKIALAEVEQKGTESSLEKVSKYLDIEMVEDEALATEIRQLAQQIYNIQNPNSKIIQNINYGAGKQINNNGKGTQINN